MDIQRPIPNQKLRADWGRAVADAIRAGRLEGDGTFRSPVGSSVAPIQPPAPARGHVPPPWTVMATWDATANSGDGDWAMRVIHGAVTRDGVALAAPRPDGQYADDRPAYTDVSRTTFGSTTGFLVVEAASASAYAWSLRRDAAAAGDGFRAIASVSWAAGEPPLVVQLHHGPVELGGGVSPGSDPPGDAVAKVLGGTDYNAAQDSWTHGEIVSVPVDANDPNSDTVEKPTYPVYNPTRLYWQESAHTLWMFRRTETYNSSGLLVAVSAETRTAVFGAVAEMP